MEMLGYFKVFPIIMIVFIAVQFGWIWSVVMGLQYKIPNEAKTKLGRFKVLFFIPLLYLVGILFFIAGVMNNMVEIANNLEPKTLFKVAAIGVPLHLFSMFCVLHSMYFVAKAIKTAELQKEVDFKDFITEFVLVWLYFVGIWVVQPQINKLVNSKENNLN
jgi:hypothetical protein